MSGGGGGRGAGVAGIPAGARKMVASLKEIVNCPEAEIYAMLKECGMDPSEAVHRLLSQGRIRFLCLLFALFFGFCFLM